MVVFPPDCFIAGPGLFIGTAVLTILLCHVRDTFFGTECCYFHYHHAESREAGNNITQTTLMNHT